MIDLKKFCGRRLRKVIAVISLLGLLLSLGAVTASAASTTRVTVSSRTVERGASTSVAFNLEGNPGIWGLKLRIYYDHSALKLNSATAGSVFEKGELMLSENLNKDPYVVVASANDLKNKTANGTIVTLNFTVSNTAEFKAHPITVEVSQANNVSGNKINISAVNGGVTVVSCVHADKEWRVTKAAKCEETGTKIQTCKKCAATFETATVNATGHQHTEVRNAVAATKTAEGYTGDTYCKDCGKLIAKGKAIPKLNDKTPVTNTPAGTSSTNSPTTNSSITSEPSANGEPEMTSGADSVFQKGSKEPLVFASNVDFSKFIRVEIDKTVLDEQDYTAEGGNTTITINADCLNQLSDGQHTVSIISENGTATAPFTVQTKTEASNVETMTPAEDGPSGSAPKSSMVPIVIFIVIIVLLAGGAGAFFVFQRRRG